MRESMSWFQLGANLRNIALGCIRFLIHGILMGILWFIFFFLPLIFFYQRMSQMIPEEIQKVNVVHVSNVYSAGVKNEARKTPLDYQSALSDFRSWLREYERFKK